MNNKIRVIAQILKEINNGKQPTHTELKIDLEHFGAIIDFAIETGLLIGAKVNRKTQITIPVKSVVLNKTKVTNNGIEFIKQYL